MTARAPFPLRRVVFVGSKAIGLAVLREMHRLAPERLAGVLTLDDRADARSVLPEIEAFCQGAGLPLHVAAGRADSEAVLARWAPDLGIVVGWYWLIAPAVLERVPGGVHGIHNSLLPRYRGGAPLVWQILNGEPEAGFSLFRFTPGMDDGPLWGQGTVPVGPDDTVGEVLQRLEATTLACFGDCYPRMLDGSAVPSAQPSEGGSYCAQRSPADGRIDWAWPARRLHDFVRAQSQPYPGAFSELDGRRLTVWRARVFEPPCYGAPGQLLRIGADAVHVACGGGTALTLLDVEWGEVRGPAPAVLRTAKSRLGAS